MAAPFGELTLVPRDGRRAVGATIVAVLGVTAFILVLDGWLFRAQLSGEYVDFYTRPLLPRAVVVSVFAMVEELRYRLLVMTGLVALALMVRIKPTTALFWAVIILAQFINVRALLIADPLYASLRFWAVGCVWGWLYWRHGFMSALLGHGSSHLLIDPLLLLALE